MKRPLLATTSLLLLFLWSPKQLCTQPKFVEVDGAKIWVNTLATDIRRPGQPLVVFESGHGTPMGNWDRVIDRVAQLAPVLTYDRPGVGESEEDDERPTIENVANKLVRLLDKLDLAPPYLLVGHSLGGVYVRGFANFYPEKLAGLIIVDPADFTETLDDRPAYYAELGLSPAKVDSLIDYFVQRRISRSVDAPQGIREEGLVLEEMRAKNFRGLKAKKVPNIPIHMLIGGRFDMPAKFRSEEYDDELLFRTKESRRLERYFDLIRSVDKGMLFYSARAGHYVHFDDPELLVSSVRIILEEVGY